MASSFVPSQSASPAPSAPSQAQMPPPPHPPQPVAARPPAWEPRSLHQYLAVGIRFALVAAGLVISFLMDAGVIGAVIALFFLVVPFEKVYPRKKGQSLRRPMVTTDVAFALMSPLLGAIGLVAFVTVGVLSLFWIPGLLLRPVVAQIPAVVLPIVAFALFDFLGYWAHRWAHEVPVLWRYHAVHHSPEHMDWISGFRLHPFDAVLIGPAVIFLLAAGFDGEVTGLLAILQIVLGIFFHANVRVRWRWLDKLVANPEFHHWHHANEADSIGHNYAPALPAWDLIFGTYFMPDRTTDRRPMHYGIDEYIPGHLVGMLVHPLRGAGKHVRSMRHPLRALKAGVRAIGRLLATVRVSTMRKTHSVRRLTAAGCSSTNSTLFGGSSEQPGIDPLGEPPPAVMPPPPARTARSVPSPAGALRYPAAPPSDVDRALY